MNTFNLLKQLVRISPRRGRAEQAAAKLIKGFLTRKDIDYVTQKFEAEIPITTEEAWLKADDKNIPCKAGTFVSGEISSKAPVVSGLKTLDFNFSEMIFYNPISEDICVNSLREFPAVAINKSSLVDLMMCKDYRGQVNVRREKFESENILVGNIEKPSKIIFAHYDSIVSDGALDNAAAVQVLVDVIEQKPEILSSNLFVFIGCEEESYSRRYGCYGFEVFDNKYNKLMDKADELIVLDGVGITRPRFEMNYSDWVMWISRIDELESKVRWLQNDQSEVMKFYHTEQDTIDILSEKYIRAAEELLIKRLRN